MCYPIFVLEILIISLARQDFDVRKAQEYVDSLSNKLSAKTVSEHVKFLRRMFGRWIEFKEVLLNPFGPGKLLLPKIRMAERPFWNQNEITTILEAAPKEYFAFWTTLAYTGMRFQEASDLTFDDIDFSQQELTITGKGGKTRVIPINDHLFPILLEQKQKFKSGLCFPQKPTTEFGCLKGLKKALKGFHFKKGGHNNHHRFRHSFASNLIRSGANPKQVQQLMGHSSINITLNIYGHLFTSDLHQAVQLLVPKGPKNTSGTIVRFNSVARA